MQQIFNSLYNAAIKNGGGEIILSFAPQAVALAALPWEVIHDGLQPILLSRGVRLGCTRVIMFAHSLPPSHQRGERLRVLTIAPRTQIDDAGRIFEQHARSLMREALSNHPVDIEPLSQASMETLFNRLNQGQVVDILDYYGHGVIVDNGGALLFENAQGRADPVVASRLAALPNLPQLVVIHACQSGQLGIDEPLAGIATALSASGVRAVVGMQLTTPMIAATNGVTPILYQELAAGKSVQQAVTTIRQKLYTEESEGASWFLPVLYLRQEDNKPFVLLERSVHCPPNPFAGEGALKDLTQFVGRETVVQWILDRLYAGGNLSIIGPTGSGKSTILALIATELWKQVESKPQVKWLPLQRSMKLTEAQLELARRLGGPRARATDLIEQLEDKHLILLLDDLGQLDKKSERGLEVRLWLRQLSQDRSLATVQLVATSLRSLNDIFKGDESPDYSPLHNVMSDSIELGPFNDDESRQFITKALEGTPFQLKDFVDLLSKPMVPRALREACRTRYDMLCRGKAQG